MALHCIRYTDPKMVWYLKRQMVMLRTLQFKLRISFSLSLMSRDDICTSHDDYKLTVRVYNCQVINPTYVYRHTILTKAGIMQPESADSLTDTPK